MDSNNSPRDKEANNMEGAGLDYEIVQLGEAACYQIWTPDENGACIGTGITHKDAVQDCICNLAATIAKLTNENYGS